MLLLLLVFILCFVFLGTSDLVCDIFRSFFRLDDDVAEVVNTIQGGRPFDYYIHMRSIRGNTETRNEERAEHEKRKGNSNHKHRDSDHQHREQ